MEIEGDSERDPIAAALMEESLKSEEERSLSWCAIPGNKIPYAIHAIRRPVEAVRQRSIRARYPSVIPKPLSLRSLGYVVSSALTTSYP